MSRYSCETRPKKRSRKTIAVLLSCCLFLLIISGCLLTALILVGKHILYNAPHKILIKNVPPSGKSGGTAAPLISRLPNDTKPILYNLTLLPNLENGQFKGFVNISIDVSRERKTIVLHSKNLSIDAVELISNSDWKVLEISNVNESVLDETITIIPKKSIPSGLYNLFIKFSGNMLHKLRGLYRSSYKDSSSGKDRVIATSKFEPTYARQAFPCFDEPNLKAKYKIHLLKPKKENYIALSNFPALPNPVSYDDQNEIVSFEETDIKMSTYLACFIVSDFKSTDYKFQNLNNVDVPFKVYASPEQLDKTTYAGQVGEKVMKEYVNYFEIDYPLPKLDMVAIPDFVSGAMEHWGLVTFRETALLYTPTTHSAANKQRVATVIAHELAHSWFGNLVTMNWWNDLWLNEGFASYIEYKGVAAAEPTWGMMDQFLIGDLHSVLALDATKNTHPIINVVETPDQITEVFDTISYNKGAAILRMLENTVGSDVFKEGVKNYLNRYAQGNAVSDNFWAEIQAVVGNAMNVQEFMNTYTIMSGYPVVTVEDDGDRYILKQKPFLTNSENFDEIPINTKWAIPITYRTDAGKSPELIWFQTTDDSITIEKPTDATWIKFNNEQIGYYRVNYPEPLWEQLIDNYDNFNISDRTHLLEETFSLAAAGQLNYKIPLSISSKLKNERDYVPWSVASTVLQEIISHLETSEHELAFKNYVKDLVNDTYNELLWNELSEEHHLENLAQVVILGLACAVGHEDCLTQATTKFDIWIDSPTPTELSQNLRGIIYKYGMKHASAEKWQKLFNRFVAEKDANEKLKLMNGLASVQDLGLLNKLLILAEDETNVRGQDYFTLLSYISANPVGTALIWDYVRENWPKLVDRFTLNDRYLGRLIPTITSRFATSTKYDEMMQFFDKYPEAGAGETSRKQALEAVENNIKWQTKYRKTIEDWIVAAA